MTAFKNVDLSKMSWSEAKMVINANQFLRIEIANNMRTYGGSFVKALAECIISADPKNTRKLINAFFGYFMDYQPSKWVQKV